MRNERCCNDSYDMTTQQILAFQVLFKRGKTYHMLATEAGIDRRPDKFEELDCFMAQRIIDFHMRGFLK